MHLGLIDRPFVPHNLASAQGSPVPLPKFQMAPRCKILMPSGSKRGTQIYYPFLSKVPASKSPAGSPMGPLWRETPVSRSFLDVSSRVPSKGALPRGAPHWASSDRNAPFSTKLATHHHIPQNFNPQQSFNETVDTSVIRIKDTHCRSSACAWAHFCSPISAQLRWQLETKETGNWY